jgi:hypothetical protein
MKDGYQCMNEYCIANNLRCTWISDGEIFIDPPKGISRTVAHRTIEKSSVSEMYYALDSWMHHYEFGKKEIKKRSKVINAFNYRIEIKPKEKGWKYPEDQRYRPSLFRYNFEFWKKTASIQINATYNAPRVTVQGRAQRRGPVDISGEKTFKDGKIAIGFRITDVFNRQGFYMKVDQPNVKQTSEFKWLTRRYFLTFTYKFGKLEISNKRQGGGDGGFDM